MLEEDEERREVLAEKACLPALAASSLSGVKSLETRVGKRLAMMLVI